MSRGRRRGGHKEEESAERWLLTYADMITLLMALFMVLFSISSVNISKYITLQRSLKAAFSGNILPGGKAIIQPGSSSSSSKAPSSLDQQAIVPVTAMTEKVSRSSQSATGSASAQSAAAAASAAAQTAAARQAAEFAQIKQRLDTYAAKHGFGKAVKTTIERRGLDIRVLTTDLLFASGQATLQSKAGPLLTEIANLLNVDQTHPIDVEGNTDNVPIRSSQFPSNWELSTARASTVVRYLIAHSLSPSRVTATGNAEQHPVESNATAAGRARNRRVEIVMQRINSSGEPSSEPSSEP